MAETENHFMQCLICGDVVKTVKGDNAKQHFRRHASHNYAQLQGDSRKICVENLKRNVRQQTSVMSAFVKTTNKRSEASYRVAYRLGVAGKPYSDGELVKSCIMDVVKCIHPGKETDYSLIPLSRDTVQRRQSNIAEQLKLSMQAKINKEDSLFALAVDESTDISDSAQLLIFIRSLSPTFELCEDLLSMETLVTQTRGEDIFLAVKKACIDSHVDLKNLRGICTDGAPAMVGKQNGLVARFSDYVLKDHGNDQLINLHCIIHQEALCSKSVDLDNILKDVNRIILFIRANALHHRQFIQILHTNDSSAEDILYHTSVRWLSQGETSRRVLLLRKEILEFYATKNKDCPLQNQAFLTSLAFLVDLLIYINCLNESLQGKGTTVCLMHRRVQDFCDKCRLLQSHIQQLNLYHFPQLTALIESHEIRKDEIPATSFSGVLEALLLEFAERFQDFDKISENMRLVASPHLVETESAPLDVQMELIELKNNTQLVKKFEDKNDLLETWKVAVEYPKLREIARNTLVLFGSTYMCEASFSRMKYLKNKYRTRLVNTNLASGIRLMISSECPDFARLSANIQEQGSH